MGLDKYFPIKPDGYPHKPVERFELDRLREHSREDREDRVIFLALNKYKIGFQIDWVHETAMFFLYKTSKKNIFMRTPEISYKSDCWQMKMLLYGLISDYYRSIGKDPVLPMYVEFELAIPVQHLYYLYWSRTMNYELSRKKVY